MTALLGTAAADGVRVLFTGIGGDELCYPRSPRSRRSLTGTGPVPDFLTPAAVAASREVDRVVEPAPAGAAMASVVQAAAVSSSCYLRHGIWPVHPLSAPELVELCARLPAAWRWDRRLSRLLLTQHGFPGAVVDAGESDDFTPVLARGMRRAWPEYLVHLWPDSRLADLGWVDPGRLVSGFTRWAAGGPPEGVVPYYAAVVLERTLRGVEAAADR
jgi:asparagine synthase (glutamine-hydrolysing)